MTLRKQQWNLELDEMIRSGAEWQIDQCAILNYIFGICDNLLEMRQRSSADEIVSMLCGFTRATCRPPRQTYALSTIIASRYAEVI
jgi:hypothetical protein